MTNADRSAFTGAYKRLELALKNTFQRETKEERAARQVVYFESLRELPLSAVLAAEARFRSLGTSDSWFPSTVEWFDTACELDADEAERAARATKQLLPPQEVLDAELARITAARDEAVATARRLGMTGMADLLEAFPIRHPSEAHTEAMRPPHCAVCADAGRFISEGVAVDCACVETNPRIRSRRALLRRRRVIESRRQRAEALAPARRRGAFTALTE